MTRRIDWRDGATKAEARTVAAYDGFMRTARDDIARWSRERHRLISRCYQKAARAAKGRK